MNTIEKVGIVFRPRRQWRPKRRTRDMKKRMNRRKWYRRNKNKIKMKQKRRYKQLSRNPLFKKWRAKRYKERNRRKFRMASEVDFDALSRPECADIPDIYFLFKESELDIDMGYVCDIDPDEDEILVFDVDDGEYKVVDIEEFVEYAVFVTVEDMRNFDVFMSQTYELYDQGLDELEDMYDDDAQLVSVQKVAAAWLSRQTPTQFALDQLRLPVTQEQFDHAMTLAAKRVGGQYDKHKGMIYLPWIPNGDPTFPTHLNVLYRKFPCGFLQKQLDDTAGMPCVSFDIIPYVGRNPRRSRAYKSINGDASESKLLFVKFLKWMKIILDAFLVYAEKHGLEKHDLFRKRGR